MSWYVLGTALGKEETAAELLKKKVDHALWENCRVLKKQQLFRIQGKYLLNRKELFPGYLFIETQYPDRLAKELEKARDFPQFIGNGNTGIAAVEEKDLSFLRDICGEDLDEDMGLSLVRTDGEDRVTEAWGALKPYLKDIVRQRLRQRYVIAKVPLFGRREEVLFGIRLPDDKIIDRYENIIKEVKAG